MIPTLGIRVIDLDGMPVASLEGEIDIANAAELRDELFATLSNQPPGLIVDLSGVTYLDSRGVHVLLQLAERMRVRHQQLRLVVPDTALIKRVLQLTHLDQIVAIDSTVEDAAERIRSEP
jgi:anti-sigma B factor antagonist